MRMCACICTLVHVSMCVCDFIRLSCVHASMCACVWVSTGTCQYPCEFMCVGAHAYVGACASQCVYKDMILSVCVCICTHIPREKNIYIHMHTNMYAHIRMCRHT